MLGCHVAGHISITGSDVRVVSCTASGVVVDDADPVDVCRSHFVGMNWDCAVDINGGSGHVVGMASGAGLVATPALAPYVATKHAVVGFSEALRDELQARGVSVFAMPHAVDAISAARSGPV